MLISNSLGSSPRSVPGTSTSVRRIASAGVCDSYTIANACTRSPPQLADALATPRALSARERRGSDTDLIGRLMREHAAAWARLSTPDAIAERAAREFMVAPNGLIRMANDNDGAELRARIRVAAVAAGVVGSRLDRLVLGVTRGIAAVVVETTLRAPLARTLERALTLRNAELERVGDAAARRQVLHNDVLIHTLSQRSSPLQHAHADIYDVDVELTRACIATDLIGLAPELFPFDGLTSSLGTSFAVEAVRAELAALRPLDDEVRVSLQSAARAARRAPPDTLDLLDAPWP